MKKLIFAISLLATSNVFCAEKDAAPTLLTQIQTARNHGDIDILISLKSQTSNMRTIQLITRHIHDLTTPALDPGHAARELFPE